MTDLRSRLLDVLDPLDPINPCTSFETIRSFLDDLDADLIHQELSKMESEGIIRCEDDFRWGGEKFAFASDLKNEDYLQNREGYENLKSAVLSEARKRGFDARWTEGHGWRLFRRPDVIAYGPMWNLAKCLDVEAA